MGPLKRFEDWPARLARALAEAARRPFAWGSHDCALFAAGVVQALTGTDPAAELRGRYETAAGAARALGSGGLAATAEALACAHGMEAIPPLMAQRGDVVLFETEGRDALGVVDLNGRIAAAGEAGLVVLPLSHAKRAWRV